MALLAEEQKQLDDIAQKYYMEPILLELNTYITEQGLIASLDYIHDALRKAKDKVDILLENRKAQGKIRHIDQARKSIAGAAFSNSLIYLFLKIKKADRVHDHIFITDKTTQKLFKEIATIYVDGEQQKPDMDIIIYSLDEKSTLKQCLILSLKTSLRERAGQTYKWKLLLEIASSDNPLRAKYNIAYSNRQMPLIGFATVNFYNEINQAQHRGMFKFFDQSFIAKPLESDFIARLSSLIDFINHRL
ncbi:MAG: BsaWI family type II restriction enzyme [Deinococcales bacterium]